MRIFRIIHDYWYYLKCRFWHKYNIVKIKTLPCTFTDRDLLLVHAMFQVLDDFVSKEKIDERINWDSDPEHRFARDKMTELLDWFHNIYLKFDEYEGLEFDWEKEGYSSLWVKNKNSVYELKPATEHDKELYKIVWERERQIRKDLTKKLKELIDIREYLWT